MARADTPPPGQVRQPAFAGRFYPADPAELAGLVRTLLAQAPSAAGPVPKALIVPHAGYIYSGPIAASAYAQFIPASQLIQRIILLGPSHRVALDGMATSFAHAFATPLGLVPLDLETTRQISSLSQVQQLDEAHACEHSLEVQLPFLQAVLGDFTLVPLAVGDAAPQDVAEVLETVWGGPETRIVISSDLSHYQDQQTAQRLDRATAQAIEALNPNGIGDERACGRIPIRGLLQVARQRQLRARTLDLRTSGDTAGPRDQVVGYGAFAFLE